MEFLDWHCGTTACDVCTNEFDRLRSSVGEVFLFLRASQSKHTVGFLSEWKYLVGSSLSGRQHFEVVKVQPRWKGSAVWRSGSEPHQSRMNAHAQAHARAQHMGWAHVRAQPRNSTFTVVLYCFLSGWSVTQKGTALRQGGGDVTVHKVNCYRGLTHDSNYTHTHTHEPADWCEHVSGCDQCEKTGVISGLLMLLETRKCTFLPLQLCVLFMSVFVSVSPLH